MYWGVLGNLQSEGGLRAQRADSRNVWEKIRLFYGCSYKMVGGFTYFLAEKARVPGKGSQAGEGE